MAEPHFSRQLIKTVNAWQAGSVDKKKKAKAIKDALKARPVEAYLTSCDDACYRRSVLVGKAVTQLFFNFAVPEETSSWTVASSVAATFKGGPPELPHPGVIFRHIPQTIEVVLNLDRMYTHEQFWPSVEHWEQDGLNVNKGIRRYGATQREVILDVEQVPHTEIYAFGSNAAEDFLKGNIAVPVIGETHLGAQELSKSFREAGLPTRRWVYEEAAARVYNNWVNNVLKRFQV